MRTQNISSLLAVAGFLAASGCGGNTMETLGQVLGAATGQPAAGGQGQITAEVQSVDTGQQTIQVRTEDGQTGAVRYDDRTVVVYREQQHPVTALERGDIVVMQLQDVQGTTYTARIDVQQSVQERTGANPSGGSGTILQLSGRVAQIDHNAGTFVLQTQNGNVSVALPYNPPQATLDYFRRLRNGATVRLEATQAGTGRVQIHRFL